MRSSNSMSPRSPLQFQLFSFSAFTPHGSRFPSSEDVAVSLIGPVIRKSILGKTAHSCHLPSMSLAELKRESAALRPEEQRELAAFLAVVRMKQSGEWDEATTKPALPEREGWVSLDEAKRQLGTIP